MYKTKKRISKELDKVHKAPSTDSMILSILFNIQTFEFGRKH